MSSKTDDLQRVDPLALLHRAPLNRSPLLSQRQFAQAPRQARLDDRSRP